MKKIVAICLLAAMVLTLLPMQVLAAETTEPSAVTEETQPVETVPATEATTQTAAVEETIPATEATEATEATVPETEVPEETTPVTQENTIPPVINEVTEDGEVIVIENDAFTEEAAYAAAEDGLTKLGTPTDLKWGYAYEWVPIEGTDTGEMKLVERPGSICWKPTQPEQGEIDVYFYRQGESEPVYSVGWRFSSEGIPEWRSIDSFIIRDLGSGTYYFTVTAIGDGTQYCDSDIATSEPWTYVQPDAQLGACTNAVWDLSYEVYDNPAVSWSNPENAGGFEVKFYRADSIDAEPHMVGQTFYCGGPGTSAGLYDYALQNGGNGYYYFQVRALSPDITKYRNGPWTEMSEPLHLTEDMGSVNTKLDGILDSGASAEEIRSAVQELDTGDLKTAMLADNTNSGTMKKIEQLEEKVGGAAPVQVNEGASAFDAGKVSVVGANLNSTAADATGGITLVIDKPARENVIPAQYDNAVAVKFSMNLENVKDPEELAVPVKITLPVPASINPNFLAILHYRADGSVEEIIMPYIYSEGGQYYASFVLTSFSDFAMTQTSSIPIYRMYNPYTQEHLLTSEEGEKEGLIDAGWSLDGTAWNAPASGAPVYRLYNPFDDFHFYTMSKAEIESLLPLGWTLDGPVSSSATEADGNPVYRLFNPYAKTNYHLFTASAEERDWLASLGWQIEGVAWYCAK